jgi:cell division protein FtsI (penicillin-binding protein 3)
MTIRNSEPLVDKYHEGIKFKEVDDEAHFVLSDVTYHRFLLLIAVVILLYLLTVIKLVNIVVFKADDIFKVKNNIINITSRPEIFDRNHNLLATNIFADYLYIRPKALLHPETSISELVRIFPDLDIRKINARIHSGSKYFFVKPNITPVQKNALLNIGDPGLVLETSVKRLYPLGSLFSHIVGYINMDGVGVSGAERYLDISYQKNFGNINSVELSLDTTVQSIVYQELSSAIEKYSAEAGMAMVMNANTGEIISLVSLPDFNPNMMDSSIKENQFNKISHAVYEVGSVMKTITFAIALDSKKVSLNDVYSVKNDLHISKFRINDYSRTHDWLSVPEIFMYSSNIGTAKMSIDVGRELQKQYLKKIGFLDTIDFELTEVGKPMYPKGNRWSDISTITISYGHGIAVTPLHLVSAFASVVNGGYLYKPTILKKNHNEEIKAERVFSEETSKQMRKLLRLVAEKGTGKGANVDGFLVGGKSGSAEKVINGVYHKKKKLSSFIAAFPIHKPEYIVYVLLDDPKSVGNLSATGGRATSPIAGEIGRAHV